MIKAQKRIIAFLLCFVMVAATLGTLTACDEAPTTMSLYTVTYDLNYVGATKRVQSYQAGVTANDWKAPRDGYQITGWYTDVTCTEEYDFSTPIESNLTLYAGWGTAPGMVNVKFEFGYSGAADKEVAIKDGTKINQMHAPKVDRYGMDFMGWYKDEALTEAWDFETDTVSGDTTLYAKFEQTINIPKDADGNVIYNNVEILLWDSLTGVIPTATLQKVVDVFNKEYEGKIKVEIGTGGIGATKGQENVLLRTQQSTDMMLTYSTYYPIGDIYSLAGLEINNDDFIDGAVRESTYAGVMLHTPIAAIVPYVVYNKALVAKYSDNGQLPTNYSELSALLQKAYEGESKTNSSFYSIMSTNGDKFNEYSSTVAFAQNNADYYQYNGLANKSSWNQDGVTDRAVTALENTYDLFGVNGANYGSTKSSYTDATVYQAVKKGNALMGLINWRGQEATIAADSTVGVMPLSGLFTDSTDEASQRIPVYTFGIGFCNLATNITNDPVRLCAAAVVVNWISEHDYLLAEEGYMPMRKSSYENEAYVNSTNATVNLLKSVGLPENFWTLHGCNKGRTIIATNAAKNTIVPYLTDAKASKLDAAGKISSLYSSICELI